jgi:cyanate lyase
MRKQICAELVLEAKHEKKMSFQTIATAIGRDVVWTTAALLGEAACSADEAKIICELLELGTDVEKALQQKPPKKLKPLI